MTEMDRIHAEPNCLANRQVTIHRGLAHDQEKFQTNANCQVYSDKAARKRSAEGGHRTIGGWAIGTLPILLTRVRHASEASFLE